MVLHGDSDVATIVVPVVGGAIGLFLAGPFGLILGVAIPLVIGANTHDPETEKDERIAELEARVEELERGGDG